MERQNGKQSESTDLKTKSSPRKAASKDLKDCLADAPLQLVVIKPIEKITVDELAAKAGVGRATYFRAFHSKQEVVTYKIVRLWDEYASRHNLKIHDRFDLDNARAFFAFNLEIRNVLQVLYQADLQQTLYDAFCQVLLDFEQETELLHRFREKYYAYGLYGLLDEWIRNDFQPGPEQMAQMLRQIVRSPYVDQMEKVDTLSEW